MAAMEQRHDARGGNAPVRALMLKGSSGFEVHRQLKENGGTSELGCYVTSLNEPNVDF
jgi:hypothetical protein